MTIQVPSDGHPRVTVSRYHDGQMVTPRIEATMRDDGKIWIEFAWTSSADGIWGRDVYLGTIPGAEKWLAAKGVRSPCIGAA